MTEKCDYCGEKFDRSPGTLTIPEEMDRQAVSEEMTIRWGNDKEMHLECWVRKKWIERGWVEEPDGRVCVFE